MHNHPFGKIDREDRKQAYLEGCVTWVTVGFALALLGLAALVFGGAI